MLKIKSKSSSGHRHINDETMAAFIENTLDIKNRERVQKHLQGCFECFENFASLKKSMKELDTIKFQSTPEEFILKAKGLKIKPEGVLEKSYSQLIDIFKGIIPSKSFWKEKFIFIEDTIYAALRWKVAVPALVVAGLVIMTVLTLQTLSPIKNDSMGSQMIISASGPLGFVDEREVVEYKGMKVELAENKDNIIFTWPEVKGAKFYHIALIVDGEKQNLTPSFGIQETSFLFSIQNIKLKTKYVWELSGKLEDGRNFQSKSEFVLTEFDN